MEKGLLCPLVVRPIEESGLFEIVAGNRRFEACKRLKLKRLPCYITELEDKEAYEVSMIENLQRKTLDPLEEAEALKKYVDEFGYGSSSELARRIGKSPSYVSRRIALLKLPEKVRRELLRAAKLGVAQELLAANLNNDEDNFPNALAELVLNKKGLTTREMRRVVREANRDEKIAAPRSYYSSMEIRGHVLDRAFNKYIASMKVCMMRLDEVLDTLDETQEWEVKEALFQHRILLHSQIDNLIRLRGKTRGLLAKTREK